MKKPLLTALILLFISAFSVAQVAPNYYAIELTDKDNNEYSLSNPEDFLSQRSIDRRSNQGIDYDISDLPISETYVEQIAGIGVEVKRRVKWINTLLVKTSNPILIDEILQLPFVAGSTKIADQASFPPVKPKEFFQVEKHFLNDEIDVSQNKSATLLNYGQAYDQINLINGIPLHEMGYQGQGMVIAVLDAGFIGVQQRSVFDSLWDNNQILGARDFASEDNNPYAGSTHGTKVLSTMGANWPGQMIGTAPKADYWLIRTEFSDYENIIEEYNWLVGAAFADSVGADIINSSLGYTTYDDPDMDHEWNDLDGNTAVVTIGADLAAKKGILPVNSAGNSGSSSWQYISHPADGDSVFAIGATNIYGEIADFSSRGYPLDPRVKPNISAVGQGSTIADAYDDIIYTGNGTSFSSPIIAGMTACLWQANPGYNNQDIMNAIQFSASQASNPDNEYGYGIPDYLAANAMVGLNFDETTNQNNVSVRPNPTNGMLYFDTDFKQFDIFIYDSKGTLVHTSKITQNAMNVQFLNDGFYMFRITSPVGNLSGKFLKK
jgi:serine protease AprX